MDKLEHLRKVCLVRVSGELVAAGKLAVRKASFSEATERLERLRELAGKFRRMQQSIEETLEDQEEVAAAHGKSVEFFTAYQAAEELLEVHIKNTTPVRAVTRKSSSGSLLDEIRQFCEKVTAATVGQFGTIPSYPNGSAQVSSCAPHSGPTTTSDGQSGAVGYGNPDGKQRLDCASVTDPTTVSSREEGEPMSNWSPLPEKHHSSIRVSTFHPGQATCDGGKDGPETPMEGVEKASVEKATTQETNKPEEVDGAAINMAVTQETRRVKWKALMPTEAISVRGIDVALPQASLDSKTCAELCPFHGIEEEQLPAIGMSTISPVRLSCNGGKGGPETSATGVEMALAGGEASQNQVVRPAAEQVEEVIINVVEAQDPRGAQRKAHLLPTEPVSCRGIDLALPRASLDSRFCVWIGLPSIQSINTSSVRAVGPDVKIQKAKHNINDERFMEMEGDQALVDTDSTESTRRFEDVGGYVTRSRFRDATFSFKQLWIRGHIRHLLKVERIGNWTHHQTASAGEGKGLRLKIKHTTEKIVAAGGVGLRQMCLKAGENVRNTLWKKEKELCEQWQHGRSTIDLDETDKSASVITAHWTSVRDTVRKIETLALTTFLAVSCGDLAGAGEDDQAPMEGKPKPSLTTRVTVNMRKTSRRGSDIGTSSAPSRPCSFIVEDEFAQPPSGYVKPHHLHQRQQQLFSASSVAPAEVDRGRTKFGCPREPSYVVSCRGSPEYVHPGEEWITWRPVRMLQLCKLDGASRQSEC
ncbi:conserved hypothetical protein [Culex quinquefasciatus]|uniref:Uncharacterized protein n=1 Tax=Culex quinquefasciatus TaxID=7176 RepID=B0WIT0_CULQU|nr:conserved hypothetical protein [Culex quinquefasciatus]|eukprot:XP_001848614.1 conserved hypothetical protein [Culex quinquefasciatus]